METLAIVVCLRHALHALLVTTEQTAGILVGLCLMLKRVTQGRVYSARSSLRILSTTAIQLAGLSAMPLVHFRAFLDMCAVVLCVLPPLATRH